MKIQNLIVGAGFSGATLARKLAEELNQKVLVIDKKDHIAGNCYDYWDKNNICIHKYGSHIFHTKNDAVWKFVNRFADFNTYMHRVIAMIDGNEVNLPFNIKSLYQAFPKTIAERLEQKVLQKFAYNSRVPILEFKNQDDEDLQFLADFIYNKVFLNYTKKQWGQSPDSIDGSVTARVPVLISSDTRYFQDQYQGIPLAGYTNLVENMLNHPNIEVRLQTDFAEIKDKVEYDRLFYSGSIDEFMGYKYGILPYRSVKFEMIELNMEYYQDAATINYPNNYDYTRVHEYKHYLRNKSPKTVIAKEYSEAFSPEKNERYYPIANNDNDELYSKYRHEAEKIDNVYFLGRLGNYKYYDMDKAINCAFELFDKVKNL